MKEYTIGMTILVAALSLALMGGCSSGDGESGDASSQVDLLTEDGGDEIACAPSCVGKECGDDGCGGDCGTCFTVEGAEDDSLCQPNGKCCAPSCVGKDCGDDGCGGSCGECGEDETCELGKCSGCEPDCGGKECGSDGCDGDCGVCYDTSGAIDDSLCTAEGVCCAPKCAGKECGDDSCGGSCGECDGDLECQNGTCIKVCKPQCEGKDCGYDGCTGVCGNCEAGFECIDGQCEVCDPECTDKECGSDGCGGQCGICDDGYVCTDGLCECVPDCDGKECGTDGCEDSCGECDDGNPCTTDECSEDGLCVYTLLPLDEIVDIGVCLCTVDEDCAGIEDDDVCNGTLKCDLEADVPVCIVDDTTIPECLDDNLCTDDLCDPIDGCIFPNDDENDCTDDDPCNGAETCFEGLCQDGEDLVCDDENPCTDDSCVENEGCLYTNNDANACANEDVCDGIETCLEGVCTAGDALVCDDTKPCTDDTCDAVDGCVYTNNDANVCLDDTVCNGDEACVDGECVAGVALVCDDMKPCTDDTCDAVDGCVYTNNNANVCLDETVCNGDETCVDGECAAGVALVCDDLEPCTDDTCDAVDGCVYTDNDANVCLDDTVCNGDEACEAGDCVAGVALVCDDLDACTADSCDPVDGCQYVNQPVDCEFSEWSAWGGCNVECGGGTETRTRTIAVEASCGGQTCVGDLEETQDCNIEPCPCAFFGLANNEFSDFELIGNDCENSPQGCELTLADWTEANVHIAGLGSTSVTNPVVFDQPNVLHLNGDVEAELQGTISQSFTPCVDGDYKRLEFDAVSGAGTTTLRLTLEVEGEVKYTQDLPFTSAEYTGLFFDVSVLGDYALQEVTLTIRNITDSDLWSYIGNLRVVGSTLVINEVDYGQTGDDLAEFVEIYNASDGPVALAGCVLYLINGSNSQMYDSFNLVDAGAELAAGQYLVVGADILGAGLPGGTLFVGAGVKNIIQNGNPDGMHLDCAIGRLDGLHYGGTIPGVGEGAKTPSDPDVGSIGRCPNGADTDENSLDFVTALTATPGLPNICD